MSQINDNTTTYRLPTHWIGPLFYGDYSGVNDEEEKDINSFLEETQASPIDIDESTKGFEPFPDCRGPAAECININFIITQ